MPDSSRQAQRRPVPVDPEQIGRLREFNRFYTRKLGLLGQQMLDSNYSLTQVRVLYEIGNFASLPRQAPTASDLVACLGLDPGYLSRCLSQFERTGLITREPVEHDRRQRWLVLTGTGKRALKRLEQTSDRQMREWLAPLSAASRRSTLAAAELLRAAFDQGPTRLEIDLGPPQAGDMGWVVASHGALYASEFGYDWEFEALVAQIVSEFVTKFDHERERCWIARDGAQILGSVFLVKRDETTAKLRLLIVDPQARGRGLGEQLVLACMDHARALGYRQMVLWTQSHLTAARNIYRRLGWEKFEEEPHHSFGLDLVAETWRVKL